MNRTIFPLLVLALLSAASLRKSTACTGISLTSRDSSHVVARTIEWGGSNLNSLYVVVPRGYEQQSYTPQGVDGMKFTADYGYVGLFYFPGYGKYPAFDPAQKEHSIADLQLVSWVLGRCKTVEDVKAEIQKVRVIATYPQASTVHWRFTDRSGRQIVLEIIDEKPIFYENKLGVLTNSPGFEWQLSNLNNYVNLVPGAAPQQPFGGIELAPFGAGSGFLGLPGDITPPSRFVRAAFYQNSAPQQDSGLNTVLQCFQILNNFDIPIGIEFSKGTTPTDIPSATQWTSAIDITHRIIYFRTMYNSTIRKIDLNDIDFETVKYRSHPLDEIKQQPVVPIEIG